MQKILTILVLILSLIGFAAAQEVYEFETCGEQGRIGPSQSDCDAYYDGTNLEGEVEVTGYGIQEWEVPSTGEYRIEAWGAEGGSRVGTGGYGARAKAEIHLEEGETLQILVGQAPQDLDDGSGGGGGSFIVDENNNPLLVAAGAGLDNDAPERHGRDHNWGPDGGGSNSGGGGGGGFETDGTDSSSEGGESFLNGGRGGRNTYSSYPSDGGFGGGGGGSNNFCGGGGGYSGGEGGTTCYGGGSYADGSNVEKETGTNQGRGSVEIELLETEPEDPENPRPAETTDTSPVYDNDPELRVDVSHPADQDLDVTFYSGSHETIGSDSVSSGDTASTVWNNREEGEEYNWYVEICDEENDCITSDTWTFEVSLGPRSPSDPDPSDGEVVTEPSDNQLSVGARYEHHDEEDGEPGEMDIYYQREDETSYEHIGTCDSLSHTEMCYVEAEVESGYLYDWYAISRFDDQEERSDWSFRVNTPPEPPELVSPEDGEESIDPEDVDFEVYVEDPDGDDMEVYVYAEDTDGDTSTFQSEDLVQSGETAEINGDNLDSSEDYEWYAEACDIHNECTISEIEWEFSTLVDPVLVNEEPADGGIVIEDEVEVEVDADSVDNEDFTVRLFRDSEELGSESSTGSQIRIEEDYGSVDFDESYEWTARASLDDYNYISSEETYSFNVLAAGSFRINTNYLYDHSTIIKADEETVFVDFELDNKATSEKDLDLELYGVDAEFVRSESQQLRVEDLESNEVEIVTIQIDESEIGEHELVVETTDLDLGSTNIDTLPLYVREGTSIDTNRVPGITTYPMLIVVLLALFVLIRTKDIRN